MTIATLAGCAPASQAEIDYPALARGRAAAAFSLGNWQVTLNVATIGFGPAYFCAAASADSDLCPIALAEYADSAAIDALDPAPRTIGAVHGLTGRIRSVSYDFAISWFPRQTSATPGPGAPGGHSAHFEGKAQKGALAIAFVADVDVTPKNQGARAAAGPPLDADVESDATALTVAVDPAGIFRDVDFDDYAVPPVEGTVVIAKDSRAYNALVHGLTVGAPPTFSWR